MAATTVLRPSRATLFPALLSSSTHNIPTNAHLRGMQQPHTVVPIPFIRMKDHLLLSDWELVVLREGRGGKIGKGDGEDG